MSHEILTEIFSRKPKGKLFHYTTQEGLLGIVGDKEIWASHTQYLNDQKEYLHALSLLIDVIDKRRMKCPSMVEKEILDEMVEGVVGNESMNVCVCSFSEEEDSLSQWRAYTKSLSGFSVGFSEEFVRKVVDSQSFYLAPCLYEKKFQIELLSALVDKVVAENIEMKRTDEYEDYPLGGSLGAYMHRYAPIIKDYSFKDEKEWRIISRPLSCKNKNYDFRPGVSMLVPYYKIPLEGPGMEFYPSSITIGPTPNIDQSERSLTSFMVSQGLKNITINKTKVPFRSW